MKSFLNLLCGRPRRSRERRQGLFVSAESCEPRILPATITVTTLADSMAVNGQVSLREALRAANNDISVDGSVAGSGHDTIRFSEGLDGTVLMNGSEFVIERGVTIRGLGADNTFLDARDLSRVFTVSVTASNVTISDMTLKDGKTTSNNLEGAGGAIRNFSETPLTISNSVITGSTTTGTSARGGAIFTDDGPVLITDSTLQSNATGGDMAVGGAIYSSQGDITLERSTVRLNSTNGLDADGGGIYIFNADLRIQDSTLEMNSTFGDSSPGGAILGRIGSIRMDRSTLSHNNTVGDSSSGGGISATQSLLVIGRSTFFGNRTIGNNSNGGAVSSVSATVIISQSTLAQNITTKATSKGGGVYSLVGPIDVRNSIIATNTVDAGVGSDIYRTPGKLLNIRSSFIGRNDTTGFAATTGSTPDSNGNFIGGNSTTTAINPLLGYLRSNGGRTRTVAVAEGSLARDSASPALAVDVTTAGLPAINSDQRGFDVDVTPGALLDMGAVENFVLEDNLVTVTVSTDTVAFGGDTSPRTVTLREAVFLANASPGHDTIVFLDSLDETSLKVILGPIEITESVTIQGRGTQNTIISGENLSRIFNIQSGRVTLQDLTLRNGRTRSLGYAGAGGAIRSRSIDPLIINRSAIIDNTTTKRGATGGAIHSENSVIIDQSTFSNNTTTGSESHGGAIVVTDENLTVSQSTFSGNSTSGAQSDGGAIVMNFGTALISQSTLTLNSAFGTGAQGGAIFSSSASLIVRNSIVARNTNPGDSMDIKASTGPGDVLAVSSSLIGRNNGTGLASTGSTSPNANGSYIGGNTIATGIQPNLSPLADNGGPTRTHLPQVGSIVINSGNNAMALDVTVAELPTLISDQRGNPIPRFVGGTVDMGAVELFRPPNRLVVSTNVDELDSDISPGDLSLREAIAMANASAGHTEIKFLDSTDGVEFDLSLGEMRVIDSVTIIGNGADSTILDAQGDSRFFAVSNGDFTLQGLTLKNGHTAVNAGQGKGGAIRHTSSGRMRIVESELSGNATRSSAGAGGAIFSSFGDLEIVNSTLSGNATFGDASYGGAVFKSGGNLTISQSTLSGNSTRFEEGLGGAVFAFAGNVLISQSTVTANAVQGVNSSGGGVYSQSASLSIRNSIVADNATTLSFPDVRKSNDAGDTFEVLSSLIGRNNGTGLTATGASATDSNGNVIGGDLTLQAVNPRLAPLTYNGGPTRTHALQAGSPAINRGLNALAVDPTAADAPLTTDQRGIGFNRLVQESVDMGALESAVVGGTSMDDEFTVSYSGTGATGTATVTVSTNGGAVVNLGTFAMDVPLTVTGLGGTDSIRINGTVDADTMTVTSDGYTINGATLFVDSIEATTLRSTGGDDIYRFNADAPLGTLTLDDAGGGTDRLDFSLTSVPVSINLSAGSVQQVNSNLSLILMSGTRFENATGGSANDVLVGSTLDNVLTGGAGNDQLTGATGSDTLLGGADDDTYIFQAASALENDKLTEGVNGGNDTLTFAAITTPVSMVLDSGGIQTAHTNRTVQLNSTIQFENLLGGSDDDTLKGNSSSNILTGGAGNDSLNGSGGNDTLIGGTDNDTYLFLAAAVAEVDGITEGANGGLDTINFAGITVPVTFSLATGAVQAAHANRTVQLNSTIQFENLIGGTAGDTLSGNSVANVIVGNAGNDVLNGADGRDILIGGLGLDTLNGGAEDDILIAGRTNHDAVLAALNDLRTAWTSVDPYATHVISLRAGVGASAASLKTTVNVLNDAGDDDSLTGGLATDWYFRALDDVITDLVAGETIDVL